MTRAVRGASAVAALLALAALAAAPGGQVKPEGAGSFRLADRGHVWNFPADHWFHDGYRTEWWYFVGFAEGEDGRRFAWQFTLFRSGLPAPSTSPDPSPWAAKSTAMGHLALADLDSGEREFVQAVYREAPGLAAFPPSGGSAEGVIGRMPGPPGARRPWTLAFADGVFSMTAGDDRAGVSIRLTAALTEPPLFHGAGGYHEKTPGGGASLYYSHTRLRVAGRVRLGGEATGVTGSGWMDREFGSSWLAPDQVGWDWFGLTLDDGRDLMVYRLHREGGSTSHASGTLRGPGGTRELRRPEVEALAEYRPADLGEEGRPYPAEWRLRIPSRDLDLRIRPLLEDQENRLPPGRPGPRIPYWEGAVEVLSWDDSAPMGRGFVELTGYRTPIPAFLGGQ